MKTFDDWYFDLFEEGNGVCLNQQEIAQESWDYQQEKINELQAKIDEIVNLVKNETPDYELDNKIQEILKWNTT